MEAGDIEELSLRAFGDDKSKTTIKITGFSESPDVNPQLTIRDDTRSRESENITDDEKYNNVMGSHRPTPCEQTGVLTIQSLSDELDQVPASQCQSTDSDEMRNDEEEEEKYTCGFCCHQANRVKPQHGASHLVEETILSSLDLAVCHIDDALHGRGSYGKAKAMNEGAISKFCFGVLDNRWYSRFLFITIIVFGVVVLWEPTQNDQHSDIHSQSSEMLVILGIHSVCLLVFLVDIVLHLVYYSCKVFWTAAETRWVRMELILTLLFLVDFLMLIVQYVVGQRLVAPFRCLRAMMIMCKARNVQHVTTVCLSIVVKLGKVFVVILLFISVFSAIGVHLFTDSYHNITADCIAGNTSDISTPLSCGDNSTLVYTGAFDNFGIAALHVFVLLTTENYPELMLPAFNITEWSFIYFGSFLYVGVFFLTSIVLAIVVDSYWEFAKKHVKVERQKEREQIVKAWNILDEHGEGRLSVDNPKLYYVMSKIKPKCNEEDLRELLDYVDEDGDGFIGTYEWTTRLADILNYQTGDAEATKRTCYEWERRRLRRVTESGVFSRCVLVILVTYAILFCIHWHGMSSEQTIIVHSLRTSITILCVIEAVMRITSSSLVLDSKVEMTDICLTFIAVTANLLWYIPITTNNTLFRSILSVISGVAMMIKVGLNSKRIREAVVMFLKIAPVMLDLMSLVLVMMYFYSVIGWEIFYDKDYPSSASPNFYNCGLGFQSFKCSFLMVFQIVSTSNWHELMNAARIQTGSDWTALYFISCYVMIVLIFMNLFVAIAIEAFNKLAVKDDGEINRGRQKRTMSVAESAKTFFTTILSSSREHDIMEITPDTVTDADDGISTQPDLGSMSSGQRKEYLLKQRRTKRKQQLLRIRVITAYRKKNPGEIDLHVGDEVKVLLKRNDMWKGETDRGKIGWFPAECVQESVKGSQRSRDLTVITEPDITQQSYVENMETNQSIPRLEDIVQLASKRMSKENLITQPGQPTATSHRYRSRAKIASQSTGDWRRKILGNMTVMNHEEMIELNKLLRAGRASNSIPVSSPDTVTHQSADSQSINQADADSATPSESVCRQEQTTPTPQILIDPILETSDEETEEVQVNNNQLSVSPTHKSTANKKKKSGGEIPVWAKQFLQKNQLSMSSPQSNDTSSSSKS